MSDTPIIDPVAIENLRSLNPGDNDEFLREIVAIFLEDTPQRIVELEQGLAALDAPKFTRAAHSIKGSSANLGASLLRTAAERIEHHARTVGLTDVAGLVDAVKTEFTRAEAELKKIIAPV
jgi:HPt (histidine-containing phosphotransfer) domain-containing protein